jgi:hypothetical protein
MPKHEVMKTSLEAARTATIMRVDCLLECLLFQTILANKNGDEVEAEKEYAAQIKEVDKSFQRRIEAATKG